MKRQRGLLEPAARGVVNTLSNSKLFTAGVFDMNTSRRLRRVTVSPLVETSISAQNRGYRG